MKRRGIEFYNEVSLTASVLIIALTTIVIMLTATF